jgi:hypothetical protein
MLKMPTQEKRDFAATDAFVRTKPSQEAKCREEGKRVSAEESELASAKTQDPAHKLSSSRQEKPQGAPPRLHSAVGKKRG